MRPKMEFPDDVRFYTARVVQIDVYFPEGHEACQFCRLFCRYEDSFRRYSCRLTDEWLLDPFHDRGRLCPLIKKEDMTDEQR